MGKFCIVPGCENRRSDDSEDNTVVNFHRFPSEREYRYREWIANIGLISFPPKTAVVCSAHFEKTCFNQTRFVLKSDAIPYLLKLDEEDERMMSTSSTALESDAGRSTAGCSGQTSQSLRSDISTLLGSDDEKQKSKIVSISSQSSTSLEFDAEDTPHCSKRQRLENTVQC